MAGGKLLRRSECEETVRVVIENGLQHEVLLNRKRMFCVRGEVATGGWALPERADERRGHRSHHRSVLQFFWVRQGGLKKKATLSEPIGKTGGQVAARGSRK
jgi:hypothetical protein